MTTHKYIAGSSVVVKIEGDVIEYPSGYRSTGDVGAKIASFSGSEGDMKRRFEGQKLRFDAGFPRLDNNMKWDIYVDCEGMVELSIKDTETGQNIVKGDYYFKLPTSREDFVGGLKESLLLIDIPDYNPYQVNHV